MGIAEADKKYPVMNCLHVLGTIGGAVYAVCVLAVIGFIASALVKVWWEERK